jgi:hypothetical protein
VSNAETWELLVKLREPKIAQQVMARVSKHLAPENLRLVRTNVR